MGMLEKKPGGGICWRKTCWIDGWMDGWRGCQVEGQNSVLFIISLVSKKTIVCLCQWAIDSCKEKGEVFSSNNTECGSVSFSLSSYGL